MLLIIAAVLAILWLFGFIAQIGGNLIHLLLLAALIILVYDLVVRNRARV